MRGSSLPAARFLFPSLPLSLTLLLNLSLLLSSFACGSASGGASDATPAVDPGAAYDILEEAQVDAVPTDLAVPEDGAVAEAEVATGADAADAVVDADATAQDAPGPASISFELDHVVQLTTVASSAEHLAFPGVVRLPDGRLMVVYRKGNGHVDPSGAVMMQFGTADGETWTAPEVLYDKPDMDDRDPSVAVLPNGDVVVDYFQYATFKFGGQSLTVHSIFFGRSKMNADGALGPFGTFVNVDGGDMAPDAASINADKLWVDSHDHPFIVKACSAPTRSIGGRLVIPAYGAEALNLAALAGAPRSRISFFESADDGKTWTERFVNPDQEAKRWLMEPALLELASGRQLLHIRTAAGNSPGNLGNALQSVSDDGGKTWSAWQDLGFIGHSPDLYQLSNGVVLTAARELNSQGSQEWVSLRASLDDGNTWGEQFQVKKCGATECGYPSIVELAGDRVLVVYYGPGGTSIQAAILRYSTVAAAGTAG
jgi:hypothetical protein